MHGRMTCRGRNLHTNWVLTLAVSLSLSTALEEREYLRGPLGRLLEGRPVAAVVEEHEARVGNVVEDRDADLEGHHPVVPPVDQEDGRLDAGEVWCIVVRQAHRLPARLHELL